MIFFSLEITVLRFPDIYRFTMTMGTLQFPFNLIHKK